MRRYPASGTVLLDGLPLPSGVIRFVPKDETSGPAAMATIVSGEFRFTERDGPIAGTHRVEIEATNFLDFEIDDEQAYAAAASKTRVSPVSRNPVPDRYHRNSSLEEYVSPTIPNRFSFELNSTSN